MLYALIMAGGSGTRFWPQSRKTVPKHHLAIGGAETLIRQTVERLEGEVAHEHILVVTIAEQVEKTRQMIPQLPPENIIAEPEGRNTAACAGLGAAVATHRGGDPMLLVVTADHVIRPKAVFWQNVRAAIKLASDEKTLVIFGIHPTWGNPGFGYIRRGSPAGEFDGIRCFQVAKFEEKPSPETAERFAASGEYYWNSGMFVWKASAILNELERHAPEVSAPLREIRRSLGTSSEKQALAITYPKIPKLPIDKAVMEKSANVKVVEATFEWDDVGSWKALPRHHPQDASGNTILGQHLGLDTHGCIIAGQPGHLIATLGVSGLIIVHTANATLVCREEDAERVKELVDSIDKAGLKRYL